MQVVMLHSQVFEVTQVALPLRRKWGLWLAPAPAPARAGVAAAAADAAAIAVAGPIRQAASPNDTRKPP